MIWNCQKFDLDLAQTRVMGIVNVTPDSFSDGGLYCKPGEAVARARACLNQGADIIDIGGESTRPGATQLNWQLEWVRLEPVLRILKREITTVPISIDTYHRETAERALDYGVAIINCVATESIPDMLSLAAKSGCGLVLPCRTVEAFQTIHGISTLYPQFTLRNQIVIDPMIGFKTTREEDMALLGQIRNLSILSPVCVGVSRKRVVQHLTGVQDVHNIVGGSVGAAIWCAMAGASIVRVHDVAETKQALTVATQLAQQTQAQV